MPSFKGVFFSIVLLGRQNPQILNHDFLVKHGILPPDKEPFKDLLKQEDSQPFTEFISTPIISSIKYGFISIAVQENLYQITDSRLESPSESAIIPITKKYFGEILRYTPFLLGGINFNGSITFSNVDDEQRFDENSGINRNIINNLAGTINTRIGTILSFPSEEGVIEIQMIKPKDRALPGIINFNYEFEYKDIDSFLGNFDGTLSLYGKFVSFLRSLDVGSES
jgi:hypothetical protein